jgi:type II secretory pathway pseudopilin PulG
MVIALIGILAALSAPFLIAAKASSNEASAIGTLRALNTAQGQYSSTCAPGYYSTSLVSLVALQFISPDAAINPKSGYTFALGPGAGAAPGPVDCGGAQSQSTYYATAVPVGRPTTGTRAFATNAAATIWQDRTGVAPDEPFATAGTVSPIE